LNIGDLVPDITLRSVTHDGMQDQKLHNLFQSKKVLIICVPGAFTSTCHTRHLPPYVKGDDELMSKKKY
jgi:peroxiredoxin